ncbi:thiamine biosynthesis protein ThiS [Rhodanobacter sp. FW510-R12]|uniref:MoaD/ThiS family protein n=1 Tax=unclassified Rhodanobacter TaxID=2621553 RepID=UPI0007A9C65D|nr:MULTISPECIES: MoaD/ThiS family protein [unclassified Rhodanobacter]KZC15954.1 thiamine biosynthesis protein ThiS [Rhodanobacter sp. FW104-R8]KZC28339.1 thiamine biosynthesis protein ThiS [Rhodanobacter sp. FW510-T8]KZC32714.1 thiamine biosynthesis protein ThiS [Rhodanobacter sp. FW510-R10]
MKIEVSLFGAFRDFEPDALVALEIPAASRVSDLRRALSAHGSAHWVGFKQGLMERSAFASATCILRDHEPLPEGERIVVLPPVGGG